MLNRIEEYVAWSVASVERLRELSRRLEQFDPRSVLAPSELQGLRQAQDDVVVRAGAARTYVLYAAFSIGEFDGWFRHVRTDLTAAVQRQFHALRPVIHRLGEIGLSVVSQEQYAEEARTGVYDLYMQSSALLRTHSPVSSDNDDNDSDANTSLPSSANWQLAEELAAVELRRRGFRDAQRTPPGADGGFDVEGRGVVAQVKYLAAPVGREAIQRLAGANTHGARMAFFSRSGYTRTAREFADVADVALFTLSVDDDAVDAVNDSGERLWA
ncbi:restriction endonuclease [Cellulosimicrobium cellulans]|uniref:restriction endonuclease n=1 Tax=Cellulosimicrobium cellulans TaxID=1710 RepID=UPI000684988A|nr:restriction endonuclease [Cellulosimicrobium cellulans]